MRVDAIDLVALASVLCLELGCGRSTDDDSGSAAGSGPASAGSETGGGANAGSANGGVSGTSAGGASRGGAGGGGGGTSGSAGVGAAGASGSASGGAAGGSSELVDCDPKKILCKSVAPQCAQGEVPSVAGSCYGDCVKIERCSCASADQCPEPNQYTCWSGKHCGPFVE